LIIYQKEILPFEFDWNYGEPYEEDYDYCLTGEYNTCHGAKIWYVPSSAILVDDELDWGRASEFYFESKLIQYNANGEITCEEIDDTSIWFKEFRKLFKQYEQDKEIVKEFIDKVKII